MPVAGPVYWGDNDHQVGVSASRTGMLALTPLLREETEAIVVNYTTECYNYAEPDEYRLPPHGSEIPYDWSRKDG